MMCVFVQCFFYFLTLMKEVIIMVWKKHKLVLVMQCLYHFHRCITNSQNIKAENKISVVTTDFKQRCHPVQKFQKCKFCHFTHSQNLRGNGIHLMSIYLLKGVGVKTKSLASVKPIEIHQHGVKHLVIRENHVQIARIGGIIVPPHWS